MNQVTEWSYDKPTQPGLYIACYGDIPTFADMEFVSVNYQPQRGLIDQIGEPISNYSDSYKWALLDFKGE